MNPFLFPFCGSCFCLLGKHQKARIHKWQVSSDKWQVSEIFERPRIPKSVTWKFSIFHEFVVFFLSQVTLPKTICVLIYMLHLLMNKKETYSMIKSSWSRFCAISFPKWSFRQSKYVGARIPNQVTSVKWQVTSDRFEGATENPGFVFLVGVFGGAFLFTFFMLKIYQKRVHEMVQSIQEADSREEKSGARMWRQWAPEKTTWMTHQHFWL